MKEKIFKEILNINEWDINDAPIWMHELVEKIERFLLRLEKNNEREPTE